MKFKDRSEKNSSEYTTIEARGFMIDRLLELEACIDNIIIKNVKPLNENLFKDIILNSSILGMGAKFKILKNIIHIDKEHSEMCHRLLNIRNSFAHTRISTVHNINVIKLPNDIIELKSSATEHQIKVLNSNGKLHDTNAKVLFDEFYNSYITIRKVLHDILKDNRNNSN